MSWQAMIDACGLGCDAGSIWPCCSWDFVFSHSTGRGISCVSLALAAAPRPTLYGKHCGNVSAKRWSGSQGTLVEHSLLVGMLGTVSEPVYILVSCAFTSAMCVAALKSSILSLRCKEETSILCKTNKSNVNV